MHSSCLLKRVYTVYTYFLSLSLKRLLLIYIALLIKSSNIIIVALLLISLYYTVGLMSGRSSTPLC
jgi:hypothetical protein